MDKKKLKLVASKIGQRIPFRTMMCEIEARHILDRWSPCPGGSCVAQNEINLEYDLQVVIPVYNREDYIEECLESVITQTTQYHYLVTVVDDGSTDKTGKILSRYDKQTVESKHGGKYTIEVITQENRGFSGARNRAIEIIRGTYILFLDSDDILPPNTIETMVSAAECWKTDLLQGAWYDFDVTSNKHIQEHRLATKNIVSEGRQMSGYPWGKLYRWNVLQHFKFPEGFWFEDTPVSFILSFMPYCFGTIDEFVYGYRLNPNGITVTSAKKKKSIDTFWITEKCLDELPAFGVEYNQEIYENFLRQSLMNRGRTRRQPRKIRKAVFVLTGNLMSIYFKDMKTESTELKEFEESIRNRKFIKYETFFRNC